MQELVYSGQLFAAAGHGWLEAAMLVFLFLVPVFQPERIQNRNLFRTACLLFALSIMVPPIVTTALSLFAQSAVPSSQGFGGMMVKSPLVVSLIIMMGPVLLGASVICGLLAVIPKPHAQRAMEPVRHPLEE